MQNVSIVCPKCSYIRTEEDRYVMEGICPSCGIAYNKWRSVTNEQPLNTSKNSVRIIEPGDPELELFEGTWPRLLSLLTYIPDKIDNVTFWGRCITYGLFLIWGLRFILNGMSWEAIGGSFMHNINLPFHEFGHVFFRPFGHFMTILGGSLFQILLPLFLAIAFVIQQKNPFAASIMLWWCGQSFIDLSPYIADATYRGLPLISGMGEESHDWGNLLTMMGWLHYDQRIAKFSFIIGVSLILISMTWGAYLLIRQRKVLSEY